MIHEKSIHEDDLPELISIVQSQEFKKLMDTFVTFKKNNVNFNYWWSYILILLLFIRAQRDGMWKLHIYAFQCMLPLFMRYDHMTYAH